MIPKLLFFFLLLLPLVEVDARSIQGVVLDSLTGEPIEFATIYIDGTSSGTTTGPAGEFYLSKLELQLTVVVSHLNYQTRVIQPAVGEDELVIKLAPRSAVLGEIKVQDGNLRAETLAEFRRLLLGNDVWAGKADLLNDEVLYFERDYADQELDVSNERMRNYLREAGRKGGRFSADGSKYFFTKRLNLKARLKDALAIELPHLGYTLRFDMVEFVHTYQSGQVTYLGTFYFQSYPNLKRRQVKNREKAYWGSTLHFARSILRGTPNENGFQVFEINSDLLPGRDTLVEDTLSRYLEPVADGLYSLSGKEGKEYQILYYSDARGRPLPRSRWKNRRPSQAKMLVAANQALINRQGIFGDNALVFSGYLGIRGLAWGLPADFPDLPLP